MAEVEMHSAEAEKLQAMEKFTGMKKINKWFSYFILSVTVAKFCRSAVGIEPILEAVLPPFRLLCLVFVPQVLQLCSNVIFLFVLCNVIILTLMMNSGLLRNPNGKEDLSCEEFVKSDDEIRPKPGAVSEHTAVSKAENRDEDATSTSLVVVEWQSTAANENQSDPAVEDDLRRRIEDFIARGHLQMRLQRQAAQPWNARV